MSQPFSVVNVSEWFEVRNRSIRECEGKEFVLSHSESPNDKTSISYLSIANSTMLVINASQPLQSQFFIVLKSLTSFNSKAVGIKLTIFNQLPQFKEAIQSTQTVKVTRDQDKKLKEPIYY